MATRVVHKVDVAGKDNLSVITRNRMEGNKKA